MPTYFRFGFGPFRFSQRLGRTQAQKRAAAKAQAQRQQWRAQRRQWQSTVSLNGIVTARTPEQAQVQIMGRDSNEVPISMIGQAVTYRASFRVDASRAPQTLHAIAASAAQSQSRPA
jgi:hypothetical protein